MSQISYFNPVDSGTALSVLQKERQEAARRPDILDVSRTVAGTEWLHNWFFRKLEQAQFSYSPDPDFSLTPQLYDELGKDLQPDYREALLGAVNLNHAMLIRDQMLDLQNARTDIARRGGGFFSVETLVNMGDPSVAVPSIASGGVVAGLSKGSTLATKLIRAGLVNAAQNVPFELARESEDPTYKISDFIANESFAATFGAVGAGIEHISPRMAQALNRLRMDGEYELATGRSSATTGLRGVVPPADAPAVRAVPTEAPLTVIQQIDQEITANLAKEARDARLATPKGQAESFVSQVMSSGLYEHGVQHEALREAVIERFGLGVRQAERLIDRLKKGARQTDTTNVFEGDTVSLAEHAEIQKRISELPKVQEQVDAAITATREGQGVKPEFIKEIAEATDSTPEAVGKFVNDSAKAKSAKPAEIAERLKPGADFGSKLGLPMIVEPGDAASAGFGFKNFGGHPVSFSDAVAFVRELNLVDKTTEYVIVKDGAGYTIGDRPRPGQKPKAKQIKVPKTTKKQVEKAVAAVKKENPKIPDRQAKEVAVRKVATEKAKAAIQKAEAPEPRKPATAAEVFKRAEEIRQDFPRMTEGDARDQAARELNQPEQTKPAAAAERPNPPETMGAASQASVAFRPDNPTAEVGDVVLTDRGNRVYREQNGGSGSLRTVNEWLADHGFDENDPVDRAVIDEARANPEDFMRRASAGFNHVMAQQPLTPQQAIQMARQPFLAHVSDAQSPAGRISIVGQIARTTIPFFRAVGRMWGEDPLNVSDAASSFVRRTYKGTIYPVLRFADNQFAQWARDQGHGLGRRIFDPRLRDAFEHEVGIEMTTPGVQGYARHATVVATAKAYRKLIDDVADMAGNIGLNGFDTLTKLKNYLPRFYVATEFVKGQALWGADFEQAWADAIIEGKRRLGSTITNDQARRVARALIDIQIDKTLYSDVERMAMLSGDRGDLLIQALQSRGMSDADIRAVCYETVIDPSAAGPPRTLYRIPLAEDFRGTYGGHEFAVQNFVDRNAGRLVHNYTRGVIGLSAEAAVLKEAGRRTGQNYTSWDQLRNAIQQEAASMGSDAIEQVGRYMPHMEVLRKMVVGIPVEADGAWPRVARTARAVFHILMMGGAGWNQFSELFRAIGYTGLRPVLRAIPEIPSMLRQAADGRSSNRFIAEMQAMTGEASDHVVHRVWGHVDPEILGPFERRTTVVEDLANRLSHATSEISGFSLVDRLTRMITMHAVGQTLIDSALSNKPMRPARLAQLGMNQAEWDRVANQIRANRSTIKSPTGRYQSFEMQNWTDPIARSKLAVAGQRLTESLIQTNDPGNYAKWMTDTTGKLIAQFRVFPIVAYEKQFRAGLQLGTSTGGDPLRMISMFALASAGAGITAMLRFYANSIGRADAEKYRRDNINWTNFSRAAVGRAGWTNMAPNLYDEGARWFGYTQQFSGTDQRTTNQKTDILTGFPALTVVKDALPRATATATREIGEVLGLRPNTPVTQSERRAFARFIPLQNAPLFKNAVDAWVTSGPE